MDNNRWSVWEWCCLLVIVFTGLIELIYFLGMFILKQETNEKNVELRQQLVGLLQFQIAQVMAIIGIVVYGKYKKTDKND